MTTVRTMRSWRKWSGLVTFGAAVLGCDWCGTSRPHIGGATGAAVVGGHAPSSELQRIYYLCFDPPEQVSPGLFRITVDGPASFPGQTRFVSRWIPAAMTDACSGGPRYDMQGQKGQPTAATPDANVKLGRRLILFGPDEFMEAPRDHRLVIVMGSNPSKFFEAVGNGSLQADERLSAAQAVLPSHPWTVATRFVLVDRHGPGRTWSGPSPRYPLIHRPALCLARSSPVARKKKRTPIAESRRGASPATPVNQTASYRRPLDEWPQIPVVPPSSRRLRVFAFDPSLATQFNLVGLNQATLEIPWEPPGQGFGQDQALTLGPTGDYVEVIDHDPSSGCFYAPVDLNDPRLLAQDGLSPSEGNPQFHQQMVYGVSMRVIDAFEKALGRRILWAPNGAKEDKGPRRSWSDQFVRRLRLYPHALREQNAYYSPEKKAVLFGYFPAATDDPVNLPGGIVFTALSHDIVAHEVSHAILDGIHPLFREPRNPDSLAFHEAFADLIALFHHFSMPEALRHQIAKTRGNLRTGSLLSELARQFGLASGKRAALRSAIDDAASKLTPTRPLEQLTEPHSRGSVLVAAVFDAFLTIFDARTEPIIALATNGTGVLPAGQLPSQLVEALAAEAAKAAGHVLRICIRALDYCPPVDLTFGEYLRALLTADLDMMPQDPLGYRVAFVEAFRRRGIYPPEVRSLAVESLYWLPPAEAPPNMQFFSRGLTAPLETSEDADAGEWVEARDREKWLDPRSDFLKDTDRRHIFLRTRAYQQRIHNRWVPMLQENPHLARAMGLATGASAPRSVRRNDRDEPTVWVSSVRLARRAHEDGRTVTDMVVELVQFRSCYDSQKDQEKADSGAKIGPPDFAIRGGCTLLIDIERAACRYCIYKNTLSQDRLERARCWRRADDPALASMASLSSEPEPFAFVHRGL